MGGNGQIQRLRRIHTAPRPATGRRGRIITFSRCLIHEREDRKHRSLTLGNGIGKHSMTDVVTAFREYHPLEDTGELVDAYRFARKRHNGQVRRNGDPYITHPLEVAYQVAKRGYGKTVIITALLHDVIEDCGISFSEIQSLFGPQVARNLSLLTKPKYIDGGWVWAHEDKYHGREDQYRKAMHNERSTIYYARLIASGNMDAIVVKFFDGSHNLKEIGNLPEAKRDRNIAVLVTHIFWLAPRILTRLDYFELIDKLKPWGHEIPEELRPRNPKGLIVQLPPRERLGRELLMGLPPTRRDYVSLYVEGGNGATGFELGFPVMVAGIDVARMLVGEFPGAAVSEQESLLAPGMGAHELIYEIRDVEPDLARIDRASRRILKECGL